MAIREKKYSLTEFEDFIQKKSNRLFELIEGDIVEKMPTEEHAHIAGIIAGEFYIYLKQQPKIKARFGVEARFQVEGDEWNDRMPDVFFRYTESPPVKQGAVIGVPDVAIEIKSPSDSYKGMREKADYYLQNGSSLVWIIYPEKQLVEVYSQDADIQILQINDTIHGGNILPDFSLSVSVLFSG